MTFLFRAYHYFRWLRSRERIIPMPSGSLLARSLSLNGSIASGPGSALR